MLLFVNVYLGGEIMYLVAAASCICVGFWYWMRRKLNGEVLALCWIEMIGGLSLLYSAAHKERTLLTLLPGLRSTHEFARLLAFERVILLPLAIVLATAMLPLITATIYWVGRKLSQYELRPAEHDWSMASRAGWFLGWPTALTPMVVKRIVPLAPANTESELDYVPPDWVDQYGTH